MELFQFIPRELILELFQFFPRELILELSQFWGFELISINLCWITVDDDDGLGASLLLTFPIPSPIPLDGLGAELLTFSILTGCIEVGVEDGDGVAFAGLDLGFSKLLIAIREAFPELGAEGGGGNTAATPGFRGLELAPWTGLVELAGGTGLLPLIPWFPSLSARFATKK